MCQRIVQHISQAQDTVRSPCARQSDATTRPSTDQLLPSPLPPQDNLVALVLFQGFLVGDGSLDHLASNPMFPPPAKNPLRETMLGPDGDGGLDEESASDVPIDHVYHPQAAAVRLGGRGLAGGMATAAALLAPAARVSIFGAFFPRAGALAAAFLAWDMWRFVIWARSEGDDEVDMAWRDLPRAYAAHLGGAGWGALYWAVRLRGRF